MSVVGFPAPQKNPTKRLDEIDLTNTADLGKPYIDVNSPLDCKPPRVEVYETREQMKESEKNDFSRYQDTSPAAKLLQSAASLIDGDRHKQHGDRHENFGTIAAYWTVLFGIDIQAWQVARAFELAKIARDVNGSANEDNAVDAAAYSALSWELRKK